MNLLPLLLICLGGLIASTQAADEVIDIVRPTDNSKLIPLAIAGYTGEANSVLRYDLEIAGFRLVANEEAQYALAGKNGAQVEGILTDKVSKKILVQNAFGGGSTRAQAHALADEVVMAIFHKSGIARTKIAFKMEKGGSSEIYVADYDGHNPMPVTTDGSIVAAPTWSPGRRLLYYTSYKAGFPDIYSHDLASGERRPIARYSGLNTSAAVSADGKRVAMILSKGGSPDLYVCNADGTGLLQLTKTREDESSPCWSPDGTKICVVSSINERRGLYIVPSHGGQMTRLATTGIPRPTEPDWSPDGKTIVFTSQRGNFRICTVPATGGDATELTDGEDPSWAPNSRTVIFTHRQKNKRTLSLLDVPSKRVKDVAQNLGSCAQPAWAK